jgi:hypothetical protein
MFMCIFVRLLMFFSFFGWATPAVAQEAQGKTIDGIPCQAQEGVVFHIHQHIAIYDRGKPIVIPAGVGIVDGTCLYWLHTHTPDGIIHIEAPVYRSFTLGEFFDVWRESLTPTRVASARVPAGQVRVYVGGHLFDDDPRTVLLAFHSDIVIEAGPPYFKPKPFTAWRGN